MKILCCIVIIAASTYIGRLMSKRVSQRYRYLEIFQSDISQLADRIIIIHMPLLSALDFSENTSTKQKFKDCAKLIENNPKSSFKMVWSDVVNENPQSFLTKQDLEMITEAGSMVEVLCSNPVKEQAELYNKRLNAYINKAYENKQKKAKLYTTSGVLLGLLVSLLII